MRPIVSIIVPVYKTKDTLEKCVRSLLNQTMKEIEVILVEDGSPDESGAICDSFTYDSRIKVIHKENGGLSSARNAGLEVSTGQYIGFVDSDDYVSEEMFEALYNTIRQDHSDVCICAHFTVDKDANITEHYFRNMPSIIEKAEIPGYLLLPLIGEDKKSNSKVFEGFVCRNLYRRELFAQYMFRSERVYFAEDIVSDLEIYSRCSRISILNRCLYYYRYNSDSLSNRYRPQVYILLNHLLEFEKQFLEENDLTSEGIQRLYATGLKFAIFSIRNAKKSNLNRQIQKQEVRKALGQPMIWESIKHIALPSYGLKMRTFVWLCRLKAVSVLLEVL